LTRRRRRGRGPRADRPLLGGVLHA